MSETLVYKPKGVCSREMRFEIEGDTIQKVEVSGGCDGNLQGICRLVEGQKIDDVVPRLSGITCGRKGTSCPDQMAQALRRA